MDEWTEERLTQQVEALFQEKRYAEALELTTREEATFPHAKPYLRYLRFCAAGRLNQPERVLQLLAAALDEGIWYTEMLLRQSPSLQGVQDRPEYEALVQRSAALQAADETVHGFLSVLEPPGAAQGLIFFLHGNGARATETQAFWQAFVAQGWRVALPQSSQVFFAGGGGIWDDTEQAVSELQAHLATLRERGALDPARTVIVGHSMGGQLALRLALSESAFQGCIGVGPYFPDLTEWEPLIAAALPHGLRVAFVVGSADDSIPQEPLVPLAATLEAHGIPALLETVPDQLHPLVPAYQPAIERALAFVLPAMGA